MRSQDALPTFTRKRIFCRIDEEEINTENKRYGKREGKCVTDIKNFLLIACHRRAASYIPVYESPKYSIQSNKIDE